MHLLGELGHAPAMKILHSEITSVAAFGHKYHSFSLTCIPVSSLHVRKKQSLTLAIDFTRAPVNLRGHRPAQACAHVATHTQCMHNMGTGTPSHHEIVFEIIHSEITSEAVFGCEYHSFSLTCKLASRPHESDHTC